MKIIWASMVAVTVSFGAWSSAAHSAEANDPDAFDVASVKPNHARDGERDISLSPGGRLTVQFATLRDLVQLAYPREDGSLRDESEIIVPVSWMSADRFDV